MMRLRTETPYEVQSAQYREEAEAYIAHEHLLQQARLAHGEHPHLDLLAWFSRFEKFTFRMLHEVERFVHSLMVWLGHRFGRPHLPPNA